MSKCYSHKKWETSISTLRINALFPNLPQKTVYYMWGYIIFALLFILF